LTHLIHARRSWDNGTFSDVTILRFPPEGFTFAELDQQDRAVKLAEVAHLRAVKAQARGVDQPHIVAFARLERDLAVEQAFPGVEAHTASGERLYSANSLLTYTLRVLLARGWLRFRLRKLRDGSAWQAAVPDDEPAWRDRARAVLALLAGEERLYLGGALGRRPSAPTTFDGFDVRRDLLAVDRLGFVREFVWRERPRIAFNAAFFLLEHDDFYSHHSALGEAYNLCVLDGVIRRPPLYHRAGFYQVADGCWRAGRFSMLDLSIQLPDGTRLVPEEAMGTSRLPGLPFCLNSEGDAGVAIYTRTLGLASYGRPQRRTPAAPGRTEYAVVDTRIVSRKAGGELEIPQNGLVLSFSPGVLPAGAIPDEGLPRVQYAFAPESLQGVQQAIQAGPLLVKDGRVVLAQDSLIQESFWPTPLGRQDPAYMGLVPTDYPMDIDRTRAGRIGLGVDGAGQLLVVAVPGTERGTHRPEMDSAGATLLELAELLAEAGAVDAINLDGGGSTQLFYEGGLVTAPGNRYGLPGVQFERMVPSIGVLR
jgi:hypothetical protein